MTLEAIVRKQKRKQNGADDEDSNTNKKTRYSHRGLTVNENNEGDDNAAVLNVLKVFLKTSSGQVEPDSEGAQLSEWLTTMENFVKQNVDPFLNRQFKKDIVISSRMVRLFSVLRECLLAHRWTDALRTMRSVARIPLNKNGLTVQRVNTELFGRLVEPDDEDDSSEKLTYQFQFIPDLREKEISLNRFLFLLQTLPREELSVDEMPQLKNAIAFKSKMLPCYKRRNVSERDRMVEDRLFSAYDGMLSYVEWLFLKQEQDQLRPACVQENVEMYDEAMRSHAETACEKFEIFEQHSANRTWDIFVAKHVELLEFLDKLNVTQSSTGVDYLGKAKVLLEQYARQNPLNPNSWRFLYRFYVRHSYDASYGVQALQELSTLVASDELVLVLHKYSCEGKVTSGIGRNRISLLFDLLDYDSWKAVVRPWSLLANDLLTFHLSSDDRDIFLESLASCWQCRRDWWPSFHFALPAPASDSEASSPSAAAVEGKEEDDDRLELICYKAVVAHFLIPDENNGYSKSVKKYVRKFDGAKPDSYYLLKQAFKLSSVLFISSTD